MKTYNIIGATSDRVTRFVRHISRNLFNQWC